MRSNPPLTPICPTCGQFVEYYLVGSVLKTTCACEEGVDDDPLAQCYAIGYARGDDEQEGE